MSDTELDVDAELLALAGDGSDGSDDDGDTSEQDHDQQYQQPDSAHPLGTNRSPSQEAKPSVEKVDDPPPSSRKGVAQKVRARRRKRKPESEAEVEGSGDGDDDVHDDSASPLAAASLGSGAMSESDGEASPPSSPAAAATADDNTPLYPLDGQYLSARDRTDILALPEIQREQILAERAAEVTKRQQDQTLRKHINANKTATAKQQHQNNKRKAAAAELLDEDNGGSTGGKRSTRPKPEKKSNTALDNYKRARELKGTGERGGGGGRVGAGRSRKDARSPSSRASDPDADGDSNLNPNDDDVEWAEPSISRSSRQNRDNDPPAELRDFERCRVGRSNLTQVHFYPGFEAALVGCFARVSIGLNHNTNTMQYRMTQIRGFSQGKPYSLTTAQGKTFHTDAYALVAHGAAQKPWPFSACSDSRFTVEEFERYTATLEKEKMRPPTWRFLQGRVQAIHALIHLVWTEEAISAKLKAQRDMEWRLNPANAGKVKREAVLKRQRDAEESGDAEEVQRCIAELTALDEQQQQQATNGDATFASSTSNGHAAGALKPSLPVKKSTATSQQENFARLNMKNRGKNAEEVRRALIEEKKRTKRARELAYEEMVAKEKAAAKAKELSDQQQAKMKELERSRKAQIREQDAKLSASAAIPSAEADASSLLALPQRNGGGESMADLFGDASDLSRAGTPVNGARRSRTGTPAAVGTAVGLKRSRSALAAATGGLGMGLGSGRKNKMEDEVLDLGIELEI